MFPEDWRLVFGPFDIGVQRAASVIHCLNCIHCAQCKHYIYSKKRRRKMKKIERSSGTKWLEWCKMFHWSLLFLCIGQLYSCGWVQYSRKPNCKQQITWGGWQRYLKMLFFQTKKIFPQMAVDCSEVGLERRISGNLCERSSDLFPLKEGGMSVWFLFREIESCHEIHGEVWNCRNPLLRKSGDNWESRIP